MNADPMTDGSSGWHDVSAAVRATNTEMHQSDMVTATSLPLFEDMRIYF